MLIGTYVGAEVFQGVTLDGVDAQLGVGLDNSETARHCHWEGIVSCIVPLHLDSVGGGRSDVRKYCLVAPPSSTISTIPGFSCSMEGTWLARTPISPEAAGMLTWVL